MNIRTKVNDAMTAIALNHTEAFGRLSDKDLLGLKQIVYNLLASNWCHEDVVLQVGAHYLARNK